MTLQELKSASGYNNIENYRQHVNTLSGLSTLGVYLENGVYYKDFYVAYHNTTTCIKVKMNVVQDTTGYLVTSGYITLEESATDMLITNMQVMGVFPTTDAQKIELLNDWYVAVETDAELRQGIVDIYGTTDTVPLWYSLADEYLHVDSDYLDIIYNYIYNKYGGNGGVVNPYKYNQREYETGTYIIPEEYHDKFDVIMGGLVANNPTVYARQGLTSKQTYELYQQIINAETPESELIKNSDAIRIIYATRPISGYYDVIVCGHTLTQPVTVNLDGSISGSVTKSVTLGKSNDPNSSRYGENWSSDIITYGNGTGVTYSTETSKSCDVHGVSYNQHISCDAVIDLIYYTGNLAPYETTGTGTVPTSNPRNVTYPNWVDTEPDPQPNPTPSPTQPLPITKPSPTRVRKPTPPRRTPEVIEDEVCDVETSENDPPSTSGALGKMYDLLDDGVKLGELANTLYNAASVERLAQIWKNSPTDGIISLHYLYIKPDTTNLTNVYLGNFNTNINANPITDRYKTFNCGTRAIDRKFNNSMDYQTSISLYLPFSGVHQLDVNEIMNSKVTVKGTVDVCTGDILYQLIVNRKSSNGTYMTDNKCLYTFNGNCKVDIPYSSSSLNSGVASGIGGVISSVITKNPLSALTGAIGTTMGGVSSVSHGGSLTGNTGAMGYKYPYFIIEYPKVIDVVERGKLFGYSSNKTIQVSSASGYTEFEKVHVDTISCTDEDRQEIERLLQNGVIL